MLAASSAVAHAADVAIPSPAPADFGTNWYVRTDLGYAWGRLDDAAAADGYTNPTDNTLGGAVIGDLGAGFKKQWLRMDVTADYVGSLSYSGTAVNPGDVAAKISAVSALFNVYLDLGTWYHVTPYVGASAGAAYMRVSDYASTVVPPFADGSHSQWNFAWGATGGLGIPVSRDLMLDAAYRYMSFGDVSTASDSFGAMTFKNVAAHEVRIGLRWSFDDVSLVN